MSDPKSLSLTTPPEPGDVPSDSDLLAMAGKLVKICVDDYGYVYDVLPFARAVLAPQRGELQP